MSEDINGLFTLQNYGPDVHSSSSGAYWLATRDSTSSTRLCYWENVGLNDWSFGLYGVRPVIYMSGVKMEKNGKVWLVQKKAVSLHAKSA